MNQGFTFASLKEHAVWNTASPVASEGMHVVSSKFLSVRQDCAATGGGAQGRPPLVVTRVLLKRKPCAHFVRSSGGGRTQTHAQNVCYGVASSTRRIMPRPRNSPWPFFYISFCLSVHVRRTECPLGAPAAVPFPNRGLFFFPVMCFFFAGHHRQHLVRRVATALVCCFN